MSNFKDEKSEILTIFMEECSEAIQEASKMLRFGNNPTELEREIGDLFAIIIS
jgi:NTP pyrophosphatase (non-canonical NTP hydrolase)